MRKRWLIGGALLGGIVATVIARRKSSSSYSDDAIDTAGAGNETFGERSAQAPEQKWAPAETRTDVSVEELSMAARLGASVEAIHSTWPSVSEEEIRKIEGDIDRLVQLIAEKVEQPREEVRHRLDDIIARETPRPSYPAH
jgi:hypothetical protein